jgi:methylmalonyl-CoA/ethylmalonyl-CoA epimerase
VGRFPPGLAFSNCGGVRLMLSSEAAAEGGNSVLYFNAPNIQEDFEALRSRMVKFTHGARIMHSAIGYELWMAFFKDAEGNTMAIMDQRGQLTT